jgi:lysophospholipase L1-like esterase
VAINQFILEGGAFDATVDFDRAVNDPANPSLWRPGFSTDQLHPSDAGAEALANAIDLSVFE